MNPIENEPSYRKISVEVCQGPDCSGLGGGAAFLEIEELIQEATHSHKHGAHFTQLPPGNTRCLGLQTIVGGCRNLCTVGPNVYIIDDDKGGTLESFHHVNSPSSCAILSQSAVVAAGMKNTSCDRNGDLAKKSNVTQSMMLRRSERLRWEALRLVTRTISKCKKDAANSLELSQAKLDRLEETCAKPLSSASRAEISALSKAGDNETVLVPARAKRRIERLMKMIRNRLHELKVESEDVSSDNEE